jgi:hypothetical protein
MKDRKAGESDAGNRTAVPMNDHDTRWTTSVMAYARSHNRLLPGKVCVACRPIGYLTTASQPKSIAETGII